MHVIIVGAGVIGVTTAYYLARAGHEVTVVDRAKHVAAGASYANGGQLSYSFSDALASPSFLIKLPRYILGADPAIRIEHLLSPALLKWAGAFLRQCTTRQAQHNSLAALKLALRSSALQKQMLENVPLEFSFRPSGKMVLIRDQKSLSKAQRNCELKRQHGCLTEVLTLAEATKLEPQLAHMPGAYSGAVYSKNDEVADARTFTEGLAKWLQSHQSVTFRMGVNVLSLNHQRMKVNGVRTGDGDMEADAIVMCAGAWTEALLAPLGISADIYPVRGYSLSLPLGDHAPDICLTDYESKIVFSRIQNQIRIAGFADFAGFDSGNDESRASALLALAKKVAPGVADYNEAIKTRWSGLRPMTPDSLPRIGSTSAKNLFLNTGHGMLGWTLACASGYDLAEAVGSQYSNQIKNSA